jgi:BlaI family penicillinase repressor
MEAGGVIGERNRTKRDVAAGEAAEAVEIPAGAMASEAAVSAGDGAGAASETEAAAQAERLTPLELEIMQVLWEAGPSTVAEVQPKLKAELAYTTVQTMLNVLLRKGKVRRAQEGRAFRYGPAVSRERATGSALSDLVQRMFGGSSEALLLAMVDSRQITAKELARVAERLQEAEDKAKR